MSTEGESGEQGKRVLMGVDAGTESIRVGLFDMTGNLVHSDSMPYQTTFPHNGWAEQSPEDWWALLGECSRKVLRDSGVHPLQVKGISIDTTCCSVVALDSEGQPLRPCLLWMDSRSANQCRSILSAAKGDSSLQVNSGGQGPLSAEWMIPKALWIKENEPDIWARATYVCEKQDYINFNLTGCMVASACNVAARWHFNAQKAVNCSLSASGESIDWASNDHGRPVSLLSKVGLLDVLDRWPTQVVALGSAIGQGLTKTAADHLGLSEGIVVAQGGPDAFVGMVYNLRVESLAPKPFLYQSLYCFFQ